MTTSVSFEKHNIDDLMSKMDRRELDSLPYGAIQLDRMGNILFYNQAQADIASRDANTVIGKNFFNEVAPCTKRPEFFGRFQDIVRNGKSVASFEYIFDYNMRPTKVTVSMKKSAGDDSYWVFLKRL